VEHFDMKRRMLILLRSVNGRGHPKGPRRQKSSLDDAPLAARPKDRL
jgi:hypothetical protein